MVSREFVINGAVVLLAALATAVAAGDVERGAELYQLCAQCHGEAGQGNQEFEAPAIAGLNQWYIEAQLAKFREGLRGMHPDDLTGLRMRPMAITLVHEGDVADVAAFVASLPAVRPTPVNSGGDATKGEAYYKICVACHGPQAEGDQKQNAPSLNRASDWYLLTQLEKFKVGIRGTDPRDIPSLLMRPMAMTLLDQQAMKDVIAYITTLPK